MPSFIVKRAAAVPSRLHYGLHLARTVLRLDADPVILVKSFSQ